MSEAVQPRPSGRGESEVVLVDYFAAPPPLESHVLGPTYAMLGTHFKKHWDPNDSTSWLHVNVQTKTVTSWGDQICSLADSVLLAYRKIDWIILNNKGKYVIFFTDVIKT